MHKTNKPYRNMFCLDCNFDRPVIEKGWDGTLPLWRSKPCPTPNAERQAVGLLPGKTRGSPSPFCDPSLIELTSPLSDPMDATISRPRIHFAAIYK
eukprot:5120354-Amphidinium_carterae.1